MKNKKEKKHHIITQTTPHKQASMKQNKQYVKIDERTIKRDTNTHRNQDQGCNDDCNRGSHLGAIMD